MRRRLVLAAAGHGGARQQAAQRCSSASTTPLKGPPRLLVQPLKPFVDARFPDAEPRVGAFLLGSAIDLHALRCRLQELGCSTLMWQGQVLMCGSSPDLGQQRCSAVFLPDGCVVCWHMSQHTERAVLKLAASHPKERRRPRHFGEGMSPAAERAEQLGLGSPAAQERLDVFDAPEGVITAVDVQDGSVRLTRDPWVRTSHQLGLSLGLAVAVRLDALERQIEARLEANWHDMHEKVHRTINLSAVSEQIFVTEKGLHGLRYELNSEAGILDAPDLLWEHALAERLYDQVVAHFDVRRRTALLNERLSYSLDYLHMLSEHVRHQYSVRLERIIIVLIFLELCVGVAAGAHSQGIASFFAGVAGGPEGLEGPEGGVRPPKVACTSEDVAVLKGMA